MSPGLLIQARLTSDLFVMRDMNLQVGPLQPVMESTVPDSEPRSVRAPPQCGAQRDEASTWRLKAWIPSPALPFY